MIFFGITSANIWMKGEWPRLYIFRKTFTDNSMGQQKEACIGAFDNKGQISYFTTDFRVNYGINAIWMSFKTLPKYAFMPAV